MKVELRKIKVLPEMSEETTCFFADVYIDGKRAGFVSNRGHGGCNKYEPYGLQMTLDAYGKTLPPFQLFDVECRQCRGDASRSTVRHDHHVFCCMECFHDFAQGKEAIPERRQDADILISYMLNDALVEQDLRKALSSAVLFTKKGQRGIYRTKGRLNKVARARIITDPATYFRNIPVDQVLNAIPFDQAVALYKKHAAQEHLN